MNETILKLNQVLTYVKQTFVGKDDIADLLGICLVSRENAFLYGPPGTAKSGHHTPAVEMYQRRKKFRIPAHQVYGTQ